MDEMEQYIEGVAYPANKYDLIDYARSQGANEEVMQAFEKLNENNYESPADVIKTMQDMGEME